MHDKNVKRTGTEGNLNHLWKHKITFVLGSVQYDMLFDNPACFLSLILQNNENSA